MSADGQRVRWRTTLIDKPPICFLSEGELYDRWMTCFGVEIYRERTASAPTEKLWGLYSVHGFHWVGGPTHLDKPTATALADYFSRGRERYLVLPLETPYEECIAAAEASRRAFPLPQDKP